MKFLINPSNKTAENARNFSFLFVEFLINYLTIKSKNFYKVLRWWTCTTLRLWQPCSFHRATLSCSRNFTTYTKCSSEPFQAYWFRDAPTSLKFNNCTLCPHCIYVFCVYLRKNSDLCHLHRKLIGFYNRDEKCLLRGTDWVVK
jgi:hypothetical protein